MCAESDGGHWNGSGSAGLVSIPHVYPKLTVPTLGMAAPAHPHCVQRMKELLQEEKNWIYVLTRPGPSEENTQWLRQSISLFIYTDSSADFFRKIQSHIHHKQTNIDPNDVGGEAGIRP